MTKKPDIDDFATLDFEASSLSQESRPIEVGLSWLAGGEVRTWSRLIRPAPSWNLADWALYPQHKKRRQQPSAVTKSIRPTGFEILGI